MTMTSHEYNLLSPALPVSLHMPSTMSSLPPYGHSQQSTFDRNVIVKGEPSDQIYMQQQQSHSNVIVYSKSKPLDYPPSDPHPHSVISQSHYFGTQQQGQSGDGRIYGQGTGEGMPPYYVQLIAASHQTTQSPENSTGSFDSPSSPFVNSNVNVGMGPSSASARISARSSSCSESPASMDPLQQQQQQYSSAPVYMGDNHVSSLVSESYHPQFWTPATSAQAPGSSQPYYVNVTTTSGSSGLGTGSSPISTAPSSSYIPPESTTAPSSTISTAPVPSSTNSYLYQDLMHQQFDFNNF
jgi:hypothetical protein